MAGAVLERQAICYVDVAQGFARRNGSWPTRQIKKRKLAGVTDEPSKQISNQAPVTEDGSERLRFSAGLPLRPYAEQPASMRTRWRVREATQCFRHRRPVCHRWDQRLLFVRLFMPPTRRWAPVPDVPYAV